MALGAGASLALGMIGGIAAAEQTRSAQRDAAAPDRTSSPPTGGGIGTHVVGASPRPSAPGRMVELAPPRSADQSHAQRSRTWFAAN
ncbi:hypothetical protein [Cellulomonas timonensis]|uniref:hypothetical protein n=1 Tax=Cellulomonas timonensis TaxID=1689271 RepID=UPI00082FFC40|nr:hypothetical protein [Cellulomonas timonensis]